MTALLSQTFNARPIRISGTPEAPLFAAVDVCAALELSNPTRALASLDPDEKGLTLSKTLGGEQEINFLTESGVYHLIFKSRKPAAAAFRRWITTEVIPEIRRTGGYGVPGPGPALLPWLPEMKLLMSMGVDATTAACIASGHLPPPGASTQAAPPPPLHAGTPDEARLLALLTPDADYKFYDLAALCAEHGLFPKHVEGAEFFGKWRLSDTSVGRFGIMLRKLSIREPRFQISGRNRHKTFSLLSAAAPHP